MLPNYYKVCLISSVLSNLALPQALPRDHEVTFDHYPSKSTRKGDRRVLTGGLYQQYSGGINGRTRRVAYRIVVDVDVKGDILLHVELFEDRPVGVTLKLGPVNEAIAKLMEPGALLRLLGNTRAFLPRADYGVYRAIETARWAKPWKLPTLGEDFLIKCADYLYFEKPLSMALGNKGIEYAIFMALAVRQRETFLEPMRATRIQDIVPREVHVHPAKVYELGRLLAKAVPDVLNPLNPLDIGKVTGVIPGHRFRWDNTLHPERIRVIT